MPIFGVAPTSPASHVTKERVLLSNQLIYDFRHVEKELKAFGIIAASILGHLLIAGIVILGMYLSALFGWNSLHFERPQQESIEFQLVEAPEELPEKPTNIVSTQNSRAGGKVDTPHPKQALKSAGKPHATLVQNKAKPVQNASPTPHPNRAPAMTRPQATHAPAKQQPTQQISQQPAAPKAPRPRVSQPTAPKASSMAGPPNPNRISLRPNTSGIIAAPASGGNGAGPVKSGPIVGGFPSVGGSGTGKNTGGTGTGSNVGPSFASGQFSKRPGGNAGGSNGPQGQQGNGGTNRGNQAGGGTQAGTGHGPVNARKDVDWSAYIRRLETRVKAQWTPPSDTTELATQFTISIAKSGALVGRTITRSSGNAAFDGSCKLAIDRAAPYWPLPPEYGKSKVNVDFTCSQHK